MGKRVQLGHNESVLRLNAARRALAKVIGARPKQPADSPTYQDLLSDIFQFLYGDPDVKDFPEVPVHRWVSHAILEWMTLDPQFAQATAATRLNLLNSLATTAKLYDFILDNDILAQMLREQDEVEGDMENQQSKSPQNPFLQKPRDASDSGESEDKQDGENKSQGDGGGSADPKDDGSSKDNKGGGSPQDDPRSTPQNKMDADSRRKMERALSRLKKFQENMLGATTPSMMGEIAKETAKEVNELVIPWGIEEGDMTTVDIDKVLEELDSKSGFISALSDIAGRYARIAATAFDDVRRQYTGVVTEATMTKNPLQLFPTELAGISPLSPRAYRALKLTEWSDNGLLGWRNINDAVDGGSIFVQVDSSGSMGEMQHNLTAKAIAVGLTWAARADPKLNRWYTLAQFGVASEGILEVNADQDWRAHWEWARTYYGGGTEFDYAISQSVYRMRQIIAERGVRGMDLIFITDGGSSLSASVMKLWKDFRAESGARLLYVDVSGIINHEVMKIADLYIPEKDLTANAEKVLSDLAKDIEGERLKRAAEED